MKDNIKRGFSNSHIKLKKRSYKKYLTMGIAYGLSLVEDSFLHKSYVNTKFCNKVLYKNEEGFVTTKYCKNRWCLVCQCNVMGKMINEYGNSLNSIEDKHLVTLTLKTVTGEQLRGRIEAMGEEWRKMLDSNRKYKYVKTLNGVKKLEVTVRPGGKYHPHYHVLVEGSAAADWLVYSWLKRWGSEASKKAQNVVKACDGHVLELLKYCTKLTTRVSRGDLKGSEVCLDRRGNKVFVTSECLDVIFRALYKKRVYQSFGNVRRLVEDVEEKAAVRLPEGRDGVIWKWEQKEADWISECGEYLVAQHPEFISGSVPLG